MARDKAEGTAGRGPVRSGIRADRMGDCNASAADVQRRRGAREAGVAGRHDAQPGRDVQTVRVYLGAHKTASTHLQSLLVAARPALAAAGTAIAAPDALRRPGGWIEAYFAAADQRAQGGPIDAATRASLRAILPAAGDLVLTDENMLGTPRDVLWHHAFYAEARRTLAVLPEAFADCRLEAFLSLRSYDGFFASMYAELVRNRGHMPWPRFEAAIAAGRWSWCDTVADLVAVFGEAQVTLWDFADFRAVQPQLVTLLSGVADPAPLIAAAGSEATRPSLSQAAIEALAALPPPQDGAAALAAADAMALRYPAGGDHPPFAPFHAVRQAELSARYRADLAAIRERWPGVRWLTPAG